MIGDLWVAVERQTPWDPKRKLFVDSRCSTDGMIYLRFLTDWTRSMRLTSVFPFKPTWQKLKRIEIRRSTKRKSFGPHRSQVFLWRNDFPENFDEMFVQNPAWRKFGEKKTTNRVQRNLSCRALEFVRWDRVRNASSRPTTSVGRIHFLEWFEMFDTKETAVSASQQLSKSKSMNLVFLIVFRKSNLPCWPICYLFRDDCFVEQRHFDSLMKFGFGRIVSFASLFVLHWLHWPTTALLMLLMALELSGSASGPRSLEEE